MDNDFQIQAIKSQIENLKIQIDNIETQHNKMSMMMGNSKIGEQLINLSIQMLNTGIQTFNLGKSQFEMIDITKFSKQIKNIHDQIKSIESTINQMNPMMGQMNNPMMNNNPNNQIMGMGMGMMDSPNNQQQMMQQQMMQQQMIQQQMMQQQMLAAQAAQAEKMRLMQEILNSPNNNENYEYLNFKFNRVNGMKNQIKMRKGKKVKDLLDKYINEVLGLNSGNLNFLYMAARIDRNEQKKIEEFFKNGDTFTITVIG